MFPASRYILWLLPLTLCACAVAPPSGPSAMVLPGNNKSMQQFGMDDASCRNFAQSQLGGMTPQEASTDSTVRSAALGTALGAALGAAAGGGRGAGTGAAAGLAFGTLAGVNAGDASARGLQRRYDAAYQQCMYAQGNRVPVYGRMVDQGPRPGAYPPPPNMPPPNMPPPPPQGY